MATDPPRPRYSYNVTVYVAFETSWCSTRHTLYMESRIAFKPSHDTLLFIMREHSMCCNCKTRESQRYVIEYMGGNTTGCTVMYICEEEECRIVSMLRLRNIKVNVMWSVYEQKELDQKYCNYCGVCQRQTHLAMCSQCRRVRYCSVPCQAAHWKQHEGVCQPDDVLD